MLASENLAGPYPEIETFDARRTEVVYSDGVLN